MCCVTAGWKDARTHAVSDAGAPPMALWLLIERDLRAVLLQHACHAPTKPGRHRLVTRRHTHQCGQPSQRGRMQGIVIRCYRRVQKTSEHRIQMHQARLVHPEIAASTWRWAGRAAQLANE